MALSCDRRERHSQAPGARPVQTEKLGSRAAEVPDALAVHKPQGPASWTFWSGFSLRVQKARDLCQLASPYSKAWVFLKKGLQNLVTF